MLEETWDLALQSGDGVVVGVMLVGLLEHLETTLREVHLGMVVERLESED